MAGGLPTREIYWNIQGAWLLYPILIICVALFCYFFYKRYKLWLVGQPEARFDQIGQRIKNVIVYILSHKKILRETMPGFMHLLLFWGMLVLAAATAAIAIQTDLGIEFIYGNFYLYFMSLGADMAGLAVFIGLLIAIYRRYIKRAEGVESVGDDLVLILFLLIIIVSGFVIEGLRIVGTDDPWKLWSPVGYVFSMMFAGMSSADISAVHKVFWWGHMVLAFAFIAYAGYSKLGHVLLIPGNVFFQSLEPKGVLPYINMEDEEAESFGVGKLEDFTWKDLYDTDACIRCGRCQNNCPAYLSEKPLSPKNLLQDLKSHMKERAGVLVSQGAGSGEEANGEANKEAVEQSAATQEIMAKTLVGDVVTEDTLWACTTCRSCMEQCPAMNEHVPKVVKMRTHQVLMESNFPPEAQIAFRGMENNGNPWNIGWQTRESWAAELGVKTMAEEPDVEYLYWPGCSGAYDARNKRVTTALVKILQAAGIKFAILGNAEKCCGDSARRMGNEYLYYSLATENIETMNSLGVKKIITQCPHCFNSLKNDYPQLGGNYEVIHHVDFLAQLLKEGKIKVTNPAQTTIAYHDSCYLGRYNEIYQTPREVLSATGANLVEMERTGDKSFCCGAGGGRMWLEEHIGSRINVMRTEQALETDADMVGTACPFCLQMFIDGVKVKDSELKTRDVAEILADAIE